MLPLVFALHTESTFPPAAAAEPPERRVFSGQVAPLFEQDRWGVSGELWGGYQGMSFNGGPETFLGAVLRRSSGAVRLSASFAYSHSEVTTERSGSASFTALVDSGERLRLGLDARALTDLQIADDDSLGERELQVLSGPVMALPLGPTEFSATGGLEVLRYRLQPEVLQGAFVHMTLDVPF